MCPYTFENFVGVQPLVQIQDISTASDGKVILTTMRISTFAARWLLVVYGAIEDYAAGVRSAWDAWRVDALHARGASKNTVLEVSIVSQGKMKPVYAVESWWSVLCWRLFGRIFCQELPLPPSLDCGRRIKHVRVLRNGAFGGFLCTGDPCDVLDDLTFEVSDAACVWTMVNGVSTRWVPQGGIRASQCLTARDIIEYLLAAGWFDSQGMQRIALRREDLSISFLNDDLECRDFVEDDEVTIP